MIKVLAFATPNSIRVPIALEELELHYELQAINVRKGEQKQADFLAINPNGKVPVIIDSDGPGGAPFTLTESGAILVYLAQKTGRLLPDDPAGQARVFEQMFFQSSGIGPAFGQAGYFKKQAPEPVPLAIARFHNEAERTLQVLDGVLARTRYTAGDHYTIADIAHFGWLWRREFADVDFAKTPNIARWYDEVASRRAVKRAIERTTALVPST